MRRVNVDQLRTLTEVIERASFSAAARKLNLTQPAVSRQIRELEQRFGVRLIERIGKKALATAAGHDLIEHGRRILLDCDSAEAAMQRFRDGWLGRVRLSTTLTAMMYQLPPIIQKLREDHPGLELVVTSAPTRDTIDQLMRHAIDLGLVTLPIKEARLRVTPLRPEMLVAIFPASMPNIPDEVTPDYVAKQQLVLEHDRGAVHALVMQWLAGELPLSRPPMPIGIIEAVKKGVASGLGISIVPDVAVAEPTRELAVRPLKPPMPCTMALVERRNKPNERALEIVRNALLTLRAPVPATSARSRRPRAYDQRKPKRAVRRHHAAGAGDADS